MSFVIDTPYGRLAWDGKFDGEESLIAMAQQAIARGDKLPLTPVGPLVTAGSRPEPRAWVAAAVVCDLLGVTPTVLEPPDLGIAEIPAGAVS